MAEGVQVAIDDVRWLRAQAGLDLQVTHIIYDDWCDENEADTMAAKALAVIDHACDPEDD